MLCRRPTATTAIALQQQLRLGATWPYSWSCEVLGKRAASAASFAAAASRRSAAQPLNMAVLMFPGFELLDLAAPVELLGAAPGVAKLHYCAQHPGHVVSSCMQVSGGSAGPSMVATHGLLEGGFIADSSGSEAPFMPDALLLPGGMGVRQEVNNLFLRAWMREAAQASRVVLTVCTGSWLLGVSGALDGIPATSNKAALRHGFPQTAAPNVLWHTKARWVEHEEHRDDNHSTLFITSSGVSAGGDAALALIARQAGLETAREVAHRAE